jgi:hypothetical protein
MAAGGKRPGAGRKPGSKSRATLEKARRILTGAGIPTSLSDLTEEQIKAMLPRDLFRLMMQDAVRQQNFKLALEVATVWAPYEHAKRTETLNLTPEEVRRIADAARSEAARRGFDVEVADGPPAGTLPH